MVTNQSIFGVIEKITKKKGTAQFDINLATPMNLLNQQRIQIEALNSTLVLTVKQIGGNKLMGECLSGLIPDSPFEDIYNGTNQITCKVKPIIFTHGKIQNGAASDTKGIVKQIKDPVIDVEFPVDQVPKILNALRIEGKI